jgi:thioredoxin-like negative regulator of GroEL
MFKKSLFFLTLLILLSSAVTAGAASGGKVGWQTNYGEALKLAKQTGKPIMIDFWASWCGPCKSMDMDVWPHPEVVARSQKFVCVSLDIDINPSLAGFFRASAVPTLVFADPWGNELGRHVGAMRPKDLALMMDGFPTDFTEAKELGAILEKDSNNAEALSGMGAFYSKMGAFETSNRYFDRALKTDEAKKNGEMRETIFLSVGLNQLKMKQFNDAKKTFERCIKDCPNGTKCDSALLGIVTAQIYQGKRGDAEKTFEQLKSRYPDSPATEQAAQNLQQMKK